MEYRVRKTTYPHGIVAYDLCEVAVLDNKPVDIGTESFTPIANSLEELQAVLRALLAATEQPPLDDTVELAEWGVEGALDLADKEDEWETEWQKLYTSKSIDSNS